MITVVLCPSCSDTTFVRIPFCSRPDEGRERVPEPVQCQLGQLCQGIYSAPERLGGLTGRDGGAVLQCEHEIEVVPQRARCQPLRRLPLALLAQCGDGLGGDGYEADGGHLRLGIGEVRQAFATQDNIRAIEARP